MQPARKKQLSETFIFGIYITVTVLLLASAVVFSVGYDNGYRIKEFTIQKTGTLTLTVSEKDAWVFIGNTAVHQTTTDNEQITIPNAEPGRQLVTVIKDNYFPWVKEVRVPSNGNLVLQPFLLRQNVEARELDTDSKNYLEVTQYFFNPVRTPQTEYQTDELAVRATENGVEATRLEDGSALETISQNGPVQEVFIFRQNPNVVLYNTGTQVWISELDSTKRLTYQILEGENIQLYPRGDVLYAKSNDSFYRINF